MTRIRTTHLFLLPVALMALLAARGASAEGPTTPDLAAGRRPGAAPQDEAASSRTEVRGDWLYVDGEPFLVKGIGYAPSRPGRAPSTPIDPAAAERDFQSIAAAGFNAIRTWRPLSPEALALADRHGLMVLQGIWTDPDGDYASSGAREQLLAAVRAEVERTRRQGNILAVLVGSELEPASVAKAGVTDVERLMRRVAQTVKDADPNRLGGQVNRPELAFLDGSAWNVAAFSLSPPGSSSVTHVFGFRSYIEQLKRTAGRGRPLIITEIGVPAKPSGAAQAEALVQRLDETFQAGAQGGVIGDLEGLPEPAYAAFARYNQAILLSPVSGERYQREVPVTVYATESVGQIRVRAGGGRWALATKLNRHWWKVRLPVDGKQPGDVPFEMEAFDVKGDLLLRRDRAISVGPALPFVAVDIATDRPFYQSGKDAQPVTYAFTVTAGGAPAADRPVYWSLAESGSSKPGVTQTATTDASGRVEGEYAANTAGVILLSAATPVDPQQPSGRRVGAEQALTVRDLSDTAHIPSEWEDGLPQEVTTELRWHEKPAFQLSDDGRERIIEYERYGTFKSVGTSKYAYEVHDWEGLAAAAGEGVYPNEAGLLRDSAYQAALKDGKLEGSHWDFTFHDSPQLAFFKWASTDEEVGVKQFYTALTLERAGLLQQAIKAYHAVLVHFPTSIGWTAFDPPTPWYVSRVARDKIEAITRLHPELGVRLRDAAVVIQNGFDNNTENDVIAVNPGRLVLVAPETVNPPTAPPAKAARTLGRGPVQLTQDVRGHWRLLVDGRPWVIRGMTYKPSAVGESPDLGPLLDWSVADRNKNGTLDALETFVDANRNDVRDPDEPVVGDFELLRRMGVNTLRFYHTDHDAEALKRELRNLHERYGFRVVMGDFVGMYTVGSGATWEQGTDYHDAGQRKRMFANVKRMVKAFKDEPYILMWVLGNENNYGGVHGIVGGVGNAGRYPKEYYTFINELAEWIHRADSKHPVAVGNGDLLFLNLIAAHAPSIDVFGANAYRGGQGFGRSFFEEVKRTLNKPVLITEYGCPAYQADKPREVSETGQALYHLGSWVDLADNMSGRGIGNVIGGIVFEWSDEWWKAGQPPRFSPVVQETHPNWAGPFPGGWNYEEWYGLASQGTGEISPFLRQLRVSYRLYEQLWKR